MAQNKSSQQQWTYKEYMQHVFADYRSDLSRNLRNALSELFGQMSERELKQYRITDNGQFFYNVDASTIHNDSKLQNKANRLARQGNRDLQGSELTTYRKGRNLHIDGVDYYKQNKTTRTYLYNQLQKYHAQGKCLDINVKKP